MHPKGAGNIASPYYFTLRNMTKFTVGIITQGGRAGVVTVEQDDIIEAIGLLLKWGIEPKQIVSIIASVGPHARSAATSEGDARD